MAVKMRLSVTMLRLAAAEFDEFQQCEIEIL